jgi:hypothetical protein
MSTFEDDRTEAQRATHRYGIAMTDAFMSGWGGATGGASVAVWACPVEWLDHVERQVCQRGEARRVRQLDLKSYRPKGNVKHVHIYVVDDAHPYSPVRHCQRATP